MQDVLRDSDLLTLKKKSHIDIQKQNAHSKKKSHYDYINITILRAKTLQVAE